MKKRLFSILLSLIVIFSIFPLSDLYTFADDSYYTYKVVNSSNKTIEITQYTGKEETVDIPQTIDGYTVVSLSSGVFSDKSSIKVINIPATINNISCYFNSPNIEEINVSNNNGYYSSEDGVLYDKAKETIIRCPYNYQAETFVIPDTVKVIGSYAFQTETYLSKTYTTMLNIEINEGVEELKASAFSYTRFKEIILPDSVKKIGNCAFSGTYAKRIHFGSGVEEVGKQMFTTQSGGRTPYLSKVTVSPDNPVFSSVDGVLLGNYGHDLIVYPQNKNDIKEYKIPDGVTYIHSCALQACGFDKLDLNNVTEIAEYAFMNSTIKGFIIPECLNDFYYEAASTGIEFTVLNPTCNFRVSYFDFSSYNVEYNYNITVKAYENSTAQAFVNNNTNSSVTYTFISLGKYGEASGDTEPEVPEEPDEPDTPDDTEKSDYVYSVINDNSIAIIEYNGNDTDLIIPSTIDGYTVTKIGSNMFEGGELTSIIIPDSVSIIARSAFRNCSELKRVTMPCSSEIWYKAFEGCVNIEKVVLTTGTGEMNNFSIAPLGRDNVYTVTPWYNSQKQTEVILCDGVKSIGSYAFYRCNNVQMLALPKTVSTIGNRAFYRSTALQEISVSPDNETYCSVNGVLYSKDKTTLLIYPSGKTDASYDIEDGTKIVSDYAFSYNDSLNTVNLSDSLKELSNYAFYESRGISEVNVSLNNFTYFSSKGILYSKDKKTLVYYPSGRDDEEFSILPSVTTIGERSVCFTKLKSINLPQGITEIKERAFDTNSELTEFYIPNTINIIAKAILPGCTALTKVTVFSYDCEFQDHTFPDSATIYSCSGSTSQAYADSYGNPFVSIGHIFVDRVEASSCTESGHVFKECTVCGYTYETDEMKELGHQYAENVIEPTCTQQGYTVFTCSRCGDSYTDKYTDALGHNPVVDKAVPETCTENGLTEGLHCSVCNEIIKAQERVRATGHIHDNGVVRSQPTCTVQGEKVFTCLKCTESYSEAIEPTGHSFVQTVTEPTCTSKGYKAFVCLKCGYSYGEAIAETDHNYVTKIINADIEKTGSQITYCSACGNVKSEASIAKIATVTLSKTSYTYTGKALKMPTVIAKDAEGNIIPGSYYTVTCISRSTGRNVSSLKAIGQYKVIVEFKGCYSGTKELYFSVKPKNVKIKSLSTGSKYVASKWAKDSSVTGYQIVIATNKSFTKNKKTVTLSENSARSYKFKNLKSGTEYYVKVRSYKTVKVDGKKAKMYSDYSSVKSIKCN